MKEFSVLISVYAREQSDYLRSALHSVFEQTVPPTEVVLVEDGPLTTELEAVITDFCEKYNTLKIVKLAKNMGLGNALNIGLSACTYDLVARMDSDDLSLPNRFEAQLKVFEENPEVSVVGGWISEFDNDPQSIISYRKLPQTDRELRRMCQLKNPLNHGSIKTKTDNLGRPSQQFIGKSATVAVNPENGTITTTWCTGSRTKRKYLKKG